MGRRQRNRGTITKALPAALATQNTAGAIRDLTAEIAAMRQRSELGADPVFDPLPRPANWATLPFGPGMPLTPGAIDPARPDSGRPEPRQYEFPVSWNLTGTSNRHTNWRLLRDAADKISLFRRCIEIRKDHMIGLEWDVVISQGAIEAAAQSSGEDVGRADLEKKLRDRLAPEIDRAATFLDTPDRGNGYQFDQWLSAMLEEVFVLDALAIYPRYTFGGELFSLEVLDGSTIKPLMNERGGRPLPPFPAYQQILYGFPRGEFTADVLDDGVTVPDAYASDQLFYSRRVTRVWTPYGYSAVEQALDDGHTWLLRHGWMKSEYTEGTSVAGVYSIDSGSSTGSWQPSQILAYEREYNALIRGSSFERHTARFLPPGVSKVDGSAGSDALAEKYKPDYDLHLLKLTAMHFDTVLPELGFTESKGLGSEGYHEGQENVQNRKRRPIIQYIEGVITRLMRTHLGMPRELEFKFLGLDDENDPGADDVEDKRQRAAVVTLNERRDALGKPRYTFPEADMPMIITGQGIVFPEGALEAAAAGAEIKADVAPKGSAPGGVPPEDAAAPGQPGTPPAPAAPPTGKATPANNGAKAAELDAYKRWRVKRAGRASRPFVFEHCTADELAGLHPDGGIDFVIKGADADPKVLTAGATKRRHWPGWDKDLAVADVYAPQISQALRGQLPGMRTIAEDWLKHGAAGADVALGWLWQHVTIEAVTEALRPVLDAVWTEGYLIGDRSALAMLRAEGFIDKAAAQPDVRTHVDWGGWTPGDVEAALALLGDDGLGEGLRSMLDRAGVTIKSIAEHRLEELAQLLAQASGEGWSSGKLARLLRDVLDDPRWARLVAVTEGARASTASTLARYLANGVEGKEWMSAEDQRVCPDCNDNELEGPLPLSAYFESGDDGPPAHPDCRCALAPVVLRREEAALAGGVDISVEDLTD
jgi:SPP1 gp7 family putative phage head morphogenesis protein